MQNAAISPEPHADTAERLRTVKAKTGEPRSFQAKADEAKPAAEQAAPIEAAAAEAKARQHAASDAAFVGYLAGWFDIARLAAGRRMRRGGLRPPEPTDA